MASIDVQATLTIDHDVAVGALMMIRDLTQFKTVGALATEKMAKVFEIADRTLAAAKFKLGMYTTELIADTTALENGLRTAAEKVEAFAAAQPKPRKFMIECPKQLSADQQKEIHQQFQDFLANSDQQLVVMCNGIRLVPVEVDPSIEVVGVRSEADEFGISDTVFGEGVLLRNWQEARQSVDDLKAAVIAKAEAINDVADDDGLGYVPPEVVEAISRRMAESLDREMMSDIPTIPDTPKVKFREFI